MKLSVVLTGALRGMGRNGTCEVLATRVITRGLPDSYYDLKILHAPSDWPDGEYMADLRALCARVSRKGRHWQIEPIPQRTPDGCPDPEQVSEP